jgi:hypothetical protein
MKGLTIICVLSVVFATATQRSSTVATQQQIPAQSSLVTSPRPLDDAALKLQETCGKAVTYEEPLLTWRGELQAMPARDPEGKWQLFPRLAFRVSCNFQKAHFD